MALLYEVEEIYHREEALDSGEQVLYKTGRPKEKQRARDIRELRRGAAAGSSLFLDICLPPGAPDWIHR